MKQPEICEDFFCPTPTCNREMLHVLKWREQRAAFVGQRGRSRRVWICLTCGCENLQAGVTRANP